VNLPKVQGGALKGEDVQLVVTVAANGTVYLNDTAMPTADLATKLLAVLREQPERNVYLRADAAVPYGDVMRVIGSLREVGVQRLGMITEPPAHS
jgi:biopolymer transport protein TolR